MSLTSTATAGSAPASGLDLCGLPQFVGENKRYKVIGKQFAGGQAMLFLAHDTACNNKLVLIRVPNSQSREARKWFDDEIKILDHLKDVPRITRVVDKGNVILHGILSQSFVVFEIAGYALRGEISQRKLSHDQCVGVMSSLCRTVHAVHKKGVIHRDITPNNILLTTDNVPILIDFGIARFTSGRGEFVENPDSMGTAGYASPEQCKGEPQTARTDVYSLGKVLAHILCGREPVCRWLQRIIDKASHERPDYRFRSAGGMGLRLDLCRSRRRILAAVVLLVVIALSVAYYVARSDGRLTMARRAADSEQWSVVLASCDDAALRYQRIGAPLPLEYELLRARAEIGSDQVQAARNRLESMAKAMPVMLPRVIDTDVQQSRDEPAGPDERMALEVQYQISRCHRMQQNTGTARDMLQMLFERRAALPPELSFEVIVDLCYLLLEAGVNPSTTTAPRGAPDIEQLLTELGAIAAPDTEQSARVEMLRCELLIARGRRDETYQRLTTNPVFARLRPRRQIMHLQLLLKVAPTDAGMADRWQALRQEMETGSDIRGLMNTLWPMINFYIGYADLMHNAASDAADEDSGIRQCEQALCQADNCLSSLQSALGRLKIADSPVRAAHDPETPYRLWRIRIDTLATSITACRFRHGLIAKQARAEVRQIADAAIADAVEQARVLGLHAPLATALAVQAELLAWSPNRQTADGQKKALAELDSAIARLTKMGIPHITDRLVQCRELVRRRHDSARLIRNGGL